MGMTRASFVQGLSDINVACIIHLFPQLIIHLFIVILNYVFPNLRRRRQHRHRGRDTQSMRVTSRGSTRGAGRKPGASLYTRKRLTLYLSLSPLLYEFKSGDEGV